MNVIDLVVIGIILIAGFSGLVIGVIKMSYKVVSYILAIVLAVKFANPVAEYFKSANFYVSIIDRIYNSILGKAVTTGANISENINKTLNNLPIPENITNKLSTNALQTSASTVATPGKDPTAYAVSTSITDLFMVIIAGIALFIVIKLLFMFIGVLVEKISDAPIIKQLDRGAGFILGCLIGIIIVYSLCTVVTMMSSSGNTNTVMDLISNSSVTKIFYNNNPITNMLANKI